MHDAFDAIEEFVVRPTQSPHLLKRLSKQQTRTLALHGVPAIGLGALTSVADMYSSNALVDAAVGIITIPLFIWTVWAMWCVVQLVKTLVEQRWWTIEPRASISASAYSDTVNITLTISSRGFPYWQPRVIEQQQLSVDEVWDMIPETVARLEHNVDVLNQNIPRIWKQRTALYADQLEEQELLALTTNTEIDHNPQDRVETVTPNLTLPSPQEWKGQKHYVDEINRYAPTSSSDAQEDRHQQALRIAEWINGRVH